MAQNIYDFKANRITGEAESLSKYKDKVVLVVNVASQCGLTPQYDALEKIYDKYKDQGFAVLGFPANEFGAQEPGSNQEIVEFCQSKFGVKFPMFEKIVVKGNGQHPLYHYLTSEKPQAVIKEGTDFEGRLKGYGHTRENKNDILWNFEKFLIGRDGKILARFNPDISPDDALITRAIELAL